MPSLSTIIISLILIAIVTLIVFNLYKKRGTCSSCGNKCAGCAMRDKCHSNVNDKI